MAASGPTYWLLSFHHFLTHLIIFKDLNEQSGLFPSRLWILAPKVCLLKILFFVFGVSLKSVRLDAPLVQRVLYPKKSF